MALVNVTNVVVLDNPTTFTNPLTFEVTFECLQELDAGELRILLFSISLYLRTTFLFAGKVQLMIFQKAIFVACVSKRREGGWTSLEPHGVLLLEVNHE